jgi:DNA-binding GntR family transcriptional regulator
MSTPTTFYQQAYTLVKERIFTLTYKPGQYLVDTELAAEMDMSRTPVREAFQQLESEGLLVREGRRGWKVYALTLHDIEEIFEVKFALEGFVARKAASCQDVALQDHLREAISAMRRAADSQDAEGWLRADDQLHAVLFDMSGNERARRIIANLNDQYYRVRAAFIPIQGRYTTTPDHERIVTAVLAGDGDTAEQALRAHLSKVRQTLVNLIVTFVLPYSQNGV